MVALAGCGAGSAANAIRPTASTAADAVGVSCKNSSGPLVVDWSSEKRASLEAALGRGETLLAIYTCPKFELLESCTAPGGYEFAAVSRKEDVIRLVNEDSVRAQLPTLAASPFFSKIEAELGRGSSLDLALVLSGRLKAKRASVSRPTLAPACTRATHFVSGVSLGAFAMNVGARAKVRTTAEIFGAESATVSSSSRDVRSQDGDLAKCSSGTSPSPLVGCSSPLRLELSPIELRSDSRRVCEDTDDNLACLEWGHEVALHRDTEERKGVAPRLVRKCMGGFREACRDALAHAHEPGGESVDVAEVQRKACGLGELGMCMADYRAALDAGDRDHASKILRDTCDRERSVQSSPDVACFRRATDLAEELDKGGKPDAQARTQEVAELYAWACVSGEPEACVKLKPLLARGLKLQGALIKGATLVQGCEQSKTGDGCQAASHVLALGVGMPKDAARAQKAWDHGCEAARARGALSCAPYPYK